MRPANVKYQVFLGFVGFLFIGSHAAMGEISLPTAVKVEKTISFQKPSGEPVQLKPGIYEVAQTGEKELSLDPVGNEGPIAIKAMPAGHEQRLDHPTAKFIPAPDNNEDKQHLILWLPDGLALEAVGSFSGVFTKSVQGWGTEETEEPLDVAFEKPIYFKTLTGEAKEIKPGAYQVALMEDGIQLISADGKGEPIAVKTDSMPTSVAVTLENFTDNPDLEALLIATANGESIVAVGSHSGVFPKGLLSGLKKVGKAVGGAAKTVAKTGYSVSKGSVKTVGKAGYAVGKDYAAKYGKKIAGRAYGLGKGVITKACGGGAAGAAKCLSIAAAAS
jgi:hypothetical protein